MIDATTRLGARIIERLREERVIWLTTVDRGSPQPAPVWFIYERVADSERIVVYSRTNARRVTNIRFNERVALNLNCSPGGGQVHVIRGVARIALELPSVAEATDYRARYRDWIEDEAYRGETVEAFATQYSVPIEITELEVWGW